MKSRKILLSIIIIAGICVAAGALMRGKLFKVKNIELFSDGIMFENQYISEMSGIKIDQSIFDINEEAVKANIDASGEYCFDSMAVLYPSTIKLTLHKRIPAALIEYENSYLAVDKNGCLIKRVDSASEYSLPIFTGMRISLYSLGNEISTSNPFQKNLMLTALKEFEETSSTKLISTVSLENFSEIYIITKNGKRIDLFEAVDVEEKLSLLAEPELRSNILDEYEHTIILYNGYFVIS